MSGFLPHTLITVTPQYQVKRKFRWMTTEKGSIQRRADTPSPHVLCHTPQPGPKSLKSFISKYHMAGH